MELLQVLSKREKNRRENTAIVEEAEQVNKDSTNTVRSDHTAEAKPEPTDSLTSSCRTRKEAQNGRKASVKD